MKSDSQTAERQRSSQVTQVSGGSLAGEAGGCLREREGEVKALAEALESQEGVRGEVARGHLAVGFLVAARGTLALEPPDQEVDTGAAVLADSRGAAARAGRQLAALACTQRGRNED